MFGQNQRVKTCQNKHETNVFKWWWIKMRFEPLVNLQSFNNPLLLRNPFCPEPKIVDQSLSWNQVKHFVYLQLWRPEHSTKLYEINTTNKLIFKLKTWHLDGITQPTISRKKTILLQNQIHAVMNRKEHFLLFFLYVMTVAT